MGGAAAGEVASSMAANEVLRRLCGRDPAAPPVEEVAETIRAANEVIFSRGQQTPELNGMGTTLVGMVTEGPHILVFNVGDSRCYWLHNPHSGPGKLEQVSLDHSLVAEEFRKGSMSAEEAQQSRFRHVITRALGTQSSILPDMFELEAELGDIFLLCSDGLSGELTDPLIESMLGVDLPLEELCLRLVSSANNAGGHDNITCMLVRAEGD
jgi:protein phosphatase